MRDDVWAYLGRAGRRLQLHRAVEWAAQGATCGALLATAWVVAAWICGWHAGLLPLAAAPLGALAGVAAAMAAGMDRRRVAMVLDRRAHLRERMATAAEMARRHADDPVARYVYAQALATAGRQGAEGVSLWSRTRRTPAAMALAVLLCVVVTSLTAGPIRDQLLQELPANLSAARIAMTPPERRDTARKLQILAGHVRTKADMARMLRQTAAALEQRPEAFDRALKELEAAVSRMARGDNQKMIAEIAAAFGVVSRDTPGPTRAVRARDDEPAAETPDPTTRADSGLVGVYDPLYAGALRTMDRPGGTGPATDRPPGGNDDRRLPMDIAWRRARRRAEAGLIANQVPTAYRGIVRRFFDTEDR